MEMIVVVRTARVPLAAVGIVAGGLLLGAALGNFAHPVPKTPADPPWAGILHPAIDAGAPDTYSSSQPEDLNPPYLVDSYPPAKAMTTPLAWWPEDLKLSRGGEYKPAPLPSLKEDVRLNDPPDEALADRDIDIPHYAAIEKAGQQVQDAAPEAATPQQDAARESPPASDAPQSGQPKVIYLADQADR